MSIKCNSHLFFGKSSKSRSKSLSSMSNFVIPHLSHFFSGRLFPNSAMRKTNDLVKRVRICKVHAHIISHLKSQMPLIMGSEKKQKKVFCFDSPLFIPFMLILLSISTCVLDSKALCLLFLFPFHSLFPFSFYLLPSSFFLFLSLFVSFFLFPFSFPSPFPFPLTFFLFISSF